MKVFFREICKNLKIHFKLADLNILYPNNGTAREMAQRQKEN